MDGARSRPVPIQSFDTSVDRNESNASGVSWSAVFAGGTVTAALGIILLALGVGFGLSAVSPWAGRGTSGRTLGGAAIVWLVAMQIIASSMGGYVAGRLRTRWTLIHGDEVYFRDTTHGLLSWAISVVATAAFLTSAGASIIGSSSSREGNGTSPSAAFPAMAMTSYVDELLTPGSAAADTAATRTEAAEVLSASIENRDTGTADRDYLTRLVTSRTGANSAEASRRVDDVITRARARLDEMRSTAARLAFWTFLALLAGAFCASYASTIGGRQRDRVKPA